MPQKASKKKIAYNSKYNSENYDAILIRVPKGMKERLQRQAERKGKSLSAYIAEQLIIEPED